MAVYVFEDNDGVINQDATAKEMPARDMTFRFLPRRFIRMNVPMMLMGMAVNITRVADIDCRNISRTDLLYLKKFVFSLSLFEAARIDLKGLEGF